MDYTVYTAVKNQFTANPTLCDLFKLLSIETWKRIEYAYARSDVKVFETTITQNLIFSINAYNDQFNLNIEVLEAVDEKANGNDIELVIQYPADGIEFYAPIQAKKIYRDGRYQSLDHGTQIESLRDYAYAKNAIPFYLLYNFTPLPPSTGYSLGSPPEWNGCTLVSAQHLFDNYYKARRSRNGGMRWKIPNFYSIHPSHAFYWHEIVCPGDPKELLRKLNTKISQDESLLPRSPQSEDIGIPENAPGFFSIGTFEKDNKWKTVKELEAIDPHSLQERYELYNSEKIRQFSYKEEKTNPEFLPKSRIILTQNSLTPITNQAKL
jgi:hypothetical protein